MITANGYKIMTNFSLCAPTVEMVNIRGETITSICPSASYLNQMQFGTLMENVNTNRTDLAAYGLYFGNGAEPPTLDDYKLAGDVVSGFSVTKITTSEYDGASAARTNVYTIANTSSTEITISEIGLVGYAWNSATSNNGHALFDRTVLDEPVTIPAGGVGQVTYTIRMNYPTA